LLVFDLPMGGKGSLAEATGKANVLSLIIK